VLKRVLVIEDEVLLRRTLTGAFREAGYDALFAGSAEEAEAHLFPETTVDLVVLDNRLPTTYGVALLRRLRASGSGCPVILMTAFDQAETRRAAEEWANGYLVKPFDLARMLSEVRRLLGLQDPEPVLETTIPRPTGAADPIHETPRR
jgi:DNA-binding response OmpR family regulator